MDNFEYSIQLNDRDWAEFYLASEECSLIQAALATAEEPLPSDLEDGEVESSLIRVRVGPGPTPSIASCLPLGAPHSHLLADEVLSGSEDETDLGSVSRFLCDSSQRSPAFPQSSAIQRSRSSHVASEPLRGQHEWPELIRAHEASFAVERRDSKTGNRLIDSNRSRPEADIVIQRAESPGRISEPEAMQKPACSVPKNAGAPKETDGQAGEQVSRPLGLARQQPTNDISQTASVDIQLPLQVGSVAVGGNPEPPELKDLNVHPTSLNFPSGESGGRDHPETRIKCLHANLKTEAPSVQEKPPLSQGHSGPPLWTLAPSDPPSENHKEGLGESKSSEEKIAADLIAEGRTDQREDLVVSVLKEEGRVDREIHSAGCRVNLQSVPGEPEASKCAQPTVVTDSRYSGTLDQHTETAGLKAESQKDGNKETCHPLVPFEGESLSTAQGSQESNFLDDNIPYCLAVENSPEDDSAVRTRPQGYDHFISGDTPEQAERMQDGASEKSLASEVGQDLPEMYGPEMYEYFFTDMEDAGVEESGGEKDTGLGMPSSSDQLWAPSIGSQDSDSIAEGEATHISVPEVYEHFFNNGAQGRKSWKRRLLSIPASEAGKVVRALKSLLSKPAHLLRRPPPSSGTALRRGSRGELVVFSPRPLGESQPRPEDLRMAVMSPERPLQLTITHRDMCLGFMALASWAVKTSNLQAPDAWKIVLLANFGTLSAIRYSRRQITAKGDHGT